MKFHRYKINERDVHNGRAQYRHYMRRFLHVYSKTDKELFSGHLETMWSKSPRTSVRFHIGNAGSETPWDGHIVILGVGFYWGHSGFRKLADWLTRCSGYKYDSRDWGFHIIRSYLHWEFANHSDMCDKRRSNRCRRTWRRGSVNLSIPTMLWGPIRYSYENVDLVSTSIEMPEGSYPVTITLQRAYKGRTRVPRDKHIKSWVLDVDAPKGIPTHHDHSGGWKGDRTYGFGVDFKYPRAAGWPIDAVNAVTAWVYKERANSGFREPQPVE